MVLDASAALAWVFIRADASDAGRAKAILRQLAVDEALVPELWHLEVVNGLAVAEKRGAITTAKATDFLILLDQLPIRTVSASFAPRREPLLSLAREHGLSAYDAAYLDLAVRMRLPIATFDRRLAQACERAGVGLV